MVSSKPGPSRPSWTSQIIWLLVALMAFVLGIQTGLSSHVACSTTTTTTSTTASLPSKSGAVVPANDDDDKKSFELAKRHSFGFFDDINDYNWKLMQQRAASRKHHKFKDPLKFYWEPARWYMNNFEPDFTCPQERRLGGPGDGPKWVCDPHRLAEVSKRRKQEKGVGCLVYSVGCGGKYHLEEGLLELLGTECEIHIFDPGDFSKDRPEFFGSHNNVYFHKWGFRSTYDETYKPVVNYGDFFTMDETMEKLGHTGRTIDIFKIDCEFCEWFSFKDWFRFDVRQILVETHGLPEKQQTALDFFYGFQQSHFYLYHKEPNIHPRAKGEGIEWAYIRLDPEFYDESYNTNHNNNETSNN